MMARSLGSDPGVDTVTPFFDGTERKIVTVLQREPCASWHHVADLAGTSESTVARRAERLIDSGAVRITVTPENVSPQIWILLQIEGEIGHIESIGEALRAREDTRFVALVTVPFDVVANIIAPSSAGIARIILRELPTIPGSAIFARRPRFGTLSHRARSGGYLSIRD